MPMKLLFMPACWISLKKQMPTLLWSWWWERAEDFSSLHLCRYTTITDLYTCYLFISWCEQACNKQQEHYCKAVVFIVVGADKGSLIIAALRVSLVHFLAGASWNTKQKPYCTAVGIMVVEAGKESPYCTYAGQSGRALVCSINKLAGSIWALPSCWYPRYTSVFDGLFWGLHCKADFPVETYTCVVETCCSNLMHIMLLIRLTSGINT